jgi:Mg-chelatase subunit ChlD
VGVVAALAAAVHAERPALGAPPEAAGSARIEVVFALDTTGSMSDLIAGAKEKIWAIANQMASGSPSPHIRMGLVGYRDRGDAYVTQVFPLSDDIDAIYGHLRSFAAGGGGDGPESVNQALHEAVTRLGWSSSRDVYKVLFLVGDAPPHMDYPDDVKYPESVRIAVQRDIRINTIQCGSLEETATVWKQIADAARGRYVALPRGGAVDAVETPWDGEFASLNRQLAETVLPYGGDEEQEATRAKVQRALEAEAAAAAARLSYLQKRGGPVVSGRGDLVDAVIEGRVEPDSLPAQALPEELRAMSPSERALFLGDRIARRRGLRSEIAWLVQKRDAFLRAQAERRGGGFEGRILDAIREQAARKGIAYD